MRLLALVVLGTPADHSRLYGAESTRIRVEERWRRRGLDSSFTGNSAGKGVFAVKTKFSDFLDQLGNLLVKNGAKNWPAIIALYVAIILPVILLALYSSYRTHRNLTHLVTSQRLGLAHLTSTTMKSEFLANISHELRTPLNAIIGFAQLMHDGRVGPIAAEHKEYLGDILGSGRHLLALINDVLDLAKVESGKMDFAPEQVETAPLVDQVRAILQNQYTGKRLSVASRIDPQVERLTVDPARFKQALYNYFSNAVKFTPAGGQIAIRVLSENEEQFRLEVEDSGVGIRPERFGELFVEFKQLEPGLSKKHQGTGLGLALTRRIVEAQGGRVGATSMAGRGSVFFAILPKRSARREQGTTDQLAATVIVDHGPRVLIVEDDKDDLQWLRQTLAKAGYAVDSATTGAEAAIKARTTHYDAILLDLILPDMLGWDVLNAVRKEDQNRDTPVIVIGKNITLAERDRLKVSATAIALKGQAGIEAVLSELRHQVRHRGAATQEQI